MAILALLVVTGLSNFLVYRFSLDAQFQQLRNQLIVIAEMASLMVDGNQLMQIPLTREGVDTSEYQAISKRLKRIKAINPSIKYIYTLRKTDQPDVLQFIVDADPELETVGKKEVTAYPGDPYPAADYPEMIRGFDESTADRSVMKDEWGVTLSGYAPIRDASGAAVALVGVDMDAQDVYQARHEIQRMNFFVLLIGIVFSTALGFFLSGQMTKRIGKLSEGTHRLAADDLEYRVEVKGHDEIAEMAAAFNQMAASLLESRKKLKNYFLGIVQSLVRILEAKDKYTQGHSERVGVFAERIALKMGLSAEEADMLKKAGELHDIGKLAIHEDILNKTERLTEEEWKIIRQHPVIGGNALKPVHFSDVIMSSVCSHHERYDGTGYPDKKKSGEVSLYAHIIAVADAYDAMTTTRSYRRGQDKQFAIGELKKNSGTQFHPKVVEAFLSILGNQEKTEPVSS